MKRSIARSTQATISSTLVASGLVLAIAGCGGGGAAEVTEASFCTDKAKAECKQLAPKCMFEESSCVSVRTTACSSRGATQKSATRLFKARNTGACIGKINSVLANPMITAQNWQDMNDTCDRVWEGDGMQQSACANNYDCLKPNICDKGFCSKQTVVGATDFCTDPGKVCPAMQYCRKNTASGFWECKPRASLSLACGPQADTTSIECTSDLRCLGGTCASKLAGGEACQADGDCMSNLCEPFRKQCVTSIQFAFGTVSCDAFVGKAITPVTPLDTAPAPVVDAAAGN